jgi:AraC family ethanolamine operon transcriptional activator
MATFKATFASMLDIDLVKVILPNTRTPSLRLGNSSFSNLYNGLFQTINEVDANSSILSHLTVDDSLYRLSVLLLHPELYFLDETHKGVRQYMTKEVVKLCEWLRANLTEPISTTHMEQQSGLSIRVLQYSFQKAFGMRPKEWVRKQRLLAARLILEKSIERVKITTPTYEYCFASPSEFSHFYIVEFGETPSETIKRTHR